MNQLRQLMLEELRRRNFATTTIRTYVCRRSAPSHALLSTVPSPRRTPYRPPVVRSSMNCSNPFMEYITILPMRVTSGPQGSSLLLQLLRVNTLTARSIRRTPTRRGYNGQTRAVHLVTTGIHR